METGPGFQDCLPKSLFLCLWPLWGGCWVGCLFVCFLMFCSYTESCRCWAVLSGKVMLGYGFILPNSLIGGSNCVLSNSQVCCGDHAVLMVNHTWGTSWLQLTNPKQQKKLLSPLFSSSTTRFFLTAPAYEFFRLPGCLGSGCLGLPCGCWALEGTHTFSGWELDCPIRRLLLKLARCDPLEHWPRLSFSLKGFEWHLGLLPILVWRFHICELQEDPIWRAHLQVWGRAFWGKLLFLGSCLRRLCSVNS